MKRRIDIEALLRWAYRDELPKAQAVAGMAVAGFGRAWGGVERYGELLSIVDAPENRWGVVPDFSATTLPHPDAIAVAEAVEALDELPLDLPEDWNPLTDLGDLGALGAAAVGRGLNDFMMLDADGRRRLRTTPGRLIMRHAIMGGAPVWEADIPEVKVECGANGRPRWFRRHLVLVDAGDVEKGIQPVYREVEVDGIDPKWHIPTPDAYQKTYLDPDPVEAVIGRAEYEVWHSALALLVEDLSAAILRDHEVIHSPRPVRPWETGDLAPQRVLPDLTKPTQRLLLRRGAWAVA